jgi:hypothetical protein
MRSFPTAYMRWLRMPAESGSRVVISKQIPDIPLHLIPKTIADQLKGKCTSVYRITAMKTFQNRFTVIIETRRREYRNLHPDIPSAPGDTKS